jgi:hypothetical protein
MQNTSDSYEIPILIVSAVATRLSTSRIDKLLETALGAIADTQDKILCQQFCVMWVWDWRWYSDAKHK